MNVHRQIIDATEAPPGQGPRADEQQMMFDADADADAPAALRLKLFESLEAAEPAWRALEAYGVQTPYQRYDWVSALVAARGLEGGRIAIVIGYRGERPVLLLPLMVKRWMGIKTARMIGWDIGNGDWMGIDPALHLDRAAIDALLAEVARLTGADLLALHSQPQSWGGISNPLLALPHQPSPDHFYFGSRAAGGSFDRFDDKRLANLVRRKRKLAETIGPVTLRMATSVEEIELIHRAFLEQRGARFAQQGIANIFAEPYFVQFMRDGAVQGVGAVRPAMAFHALYAGETIVATAFGSFAGEHYSQYINATASGDIAKFRLIGILMHELFADCAQRGATTIDMGLGDFDYKADWSEPQTVYDSVVPLSALGQAAAPALLGLRKAKRAIKQNEQLFSLFKRMRGLLRGSHN